MQVLLFNQFFSSPKGSPNVYLAITPMNLLYLANYLKMKSIPCKIFELGIHRFDKPIEVESRIRFGISDQAIIEIIKKESPKIIGIGCMFSRHYIDILYIARLIKKTDPDIKVVVGGNHATSYVEMVLKEKSIDFVVTGEGEITFFELCQRILDKKNEFNDISGLAFRNDENKPVITNMRPLIQNLDSIPIIDYSFIDIKNYLDDSRISPFLMRYPSFDIISSRGCPGKCVFCTVKNVWGRNWRGRSPKHFVDEIEILYNHHGVREFAIVDDSASLDKKRWLSICNEIIDRKLDIKWTTPNGLAHWTLDKDILKKMKEAGCYRITFGIESGNLETRRFIGKPYNLEQAKKLLHFANKIGMWTICTNIIGFPYETKSAMEDTIRFAKTCGADFSTFFLLSPHVTSDVYSYFRKENLLNFDSIFNSEQLDEQVYEEMENALSEDGTNTLFFTRDELKKMQAKAYRSFIIYRGISFLFTLRLVRKIHNLEDFRCALRFMFTGIKIFLRSFFMKNTLTLLYD